MLIGLFTNAELTKDFGNGVFMPSGHWNRIGEMMKADEMLLEVKPHCSSFSQLKEIYAEYFTEEEVEHLFPLLIRWAGSEKEALDWFQNTPLAACGGKTARELCLNHQGAVLKDYIHSLELDGFA